MLIHPNGMIKLLIKFNNWKSIVKPVQNTFESILFRLFTLATYDGYVMHGLGFTHISYK